MPGTLGVICKWQLAKQLLPKLRESRELHQTMNYKGSELERPMGVKRGAGGTWLSVDLTQYAGRAVRILRCRVTITFLARLNM